MTTGGPEQPAQPFGASEYPSLENSPAPPSPHAPVDYPTDAGLPPPLYAPPPPPPGYYPAYDPYQQIKPLGTNGKAIAALVLSVGSLIVCCGIPPTALPGLILGVIGMRETRRTGQDGYGLALAGAIIGGIATAAGVIIVLLYVALIASGWQWI